MTAKSNPSEAAASTEIDPLWIALATHTSDFFGLMDERGVVLFINRSVRGAESDDITGKTLEEFLTTARAHQVRGMLNEARETGQPVINDSLRIDALDGDERWFVEKCIPTESDGALRFLLIRTETTHLRRAELELRASEARYRTLFDSNPDPVVVVEASSLDILAANPAASRLYGHTQQELCAMQWVELFAPEDHDALRDRLHANPALERRWVVRQERRDGSSVISEIVDNPIAFAGREARIAVIRDVTEREQLEEQLRHAQKMEAMGVFAGGVAHDFNNLLTVIAGCGENLRAVAGPGSEASQDVDDLLDAMERGSNLTKKLMLFSRRLVLNTMSIDLVRVIDDLRPILVRLLGDGVAFEVHHRAPSALVLGDQVELEQLVSNLVLNAGQAIAGTGRVIVRTSLLDVDSSFTARFPRAHADRYVEICVSDDGHGMDEATLTRAFEPFFTTKPDGTGLGLAVVHGVVERHRGFLHAESKPGVGTSIHAYLPVSVDFPAVSLGRPIAPVGSERVLVVDDEPMVRKITERTLRRLGYQVTGAGDAEEALTLFSNDPNKFDVVVMDVVMPKLSGPEAVSQMRVVRPGFRALFVTGYAREASGLSTLLGEPGIGFLPKPFTALQLAEEIRLVLDDVTAPSSAR